MRPPYVENYPGSRDETKMSCRWRNVVFLRAEARVGGETLGNTQAFTGRATRRRFAERRGAENDAASRVSRVGLSQRVNIRWVLTTIIDVKMTALPCLNLTEQGREASCLLKGKVELLLHIEPTWLTHSAYLWTRWLASSSAAGRRQPTTASCSSSGFGELRVSSSGPRVLENFLRDERAEF